MAVGASQTFRRLKHIKTWGCSIPRLMWSSWCRRAAGRHHSLLGSGHTDKHRSPALSSLINLVPQIFLDGSIYHLFLINSVPHPLAPFQTSSKSHLQQANGIYSFHMQSTSGTPGTLEVQVRPCPSLRTTASLEHTISSAMFWISTSGCWELVRPLRGGGIQRQ